MEAPSITATDRSIGIMAEPISTFDIFKIGIGPSSSHTMGPWKAVRRCLTDMAGEGLLARVTLVQVVLYGSLAKTGRGHGTDKAILLGLMGEDPEFIAVASIPERLAIVRRERRIALLGEHTIPFDPERDLLLRREETRPFHANAMDVVVHLDDGSRRTETYYSVGGGFIVQEGERQGGGRQDAARPAPPHPCTTGAEVRAHAERVGGAISDLVRINERTWRTDAEIDGRLDQLWRTMKAFVHAGCHADGTLPGGLQVQRRARRLSRKLLGGAADSLPDEAGVDAWLDLVARAPRDFGEVNKWVSCFAIATNEENAAFGRVVTAPTNGAAGVIPAVLLYHVCFGDGTDRDARRFLLTAGQIGSLFKQAATISAAMGGCQAEIGVSAAMAAAALTECVGGSVEQALMAAEIAMEHHLGLTCDPVGGLVQIPCIERNTMGAMKAITASNIALESDPSQARISLDAVIRTMWETARDMDERYKETSEGGLALQLSVNLSEC